MKIECKTPGGKELIIDVSTSMAEVPAVALAGQYKGPFKLLPSQKTAEVKKLNLDWYIVIGDKPVMITDTDMTKIKAAEKECALARFNAEKNILNQNVPGLDLLRTVFDDVDRYMSQFAQMMEDENNDGVNPPKQVAGKSEELAKQYPRAALYLKAEGYSYASHHAKSSAGDKAMDILKNGGSIDEARKLLDNWLDDTFID